MRQAIQVLIFIYRQTGEGREYLMLRRIPRLLGFWQPVSGGVEDDEDIGTTARRELQEETGFAPGAVESIDYAYYIPTWHDRKLKSKHGTDHTMPVHVFVAQVDDGVDPVIDPEEHDMFLWCPIGQAERLLYWPSDREALRQVEAWVNLRRG